MGPFESFGLEINTRFESWVSCLWLQACWKGSGTSPLHVTRLNPSCVFHFISQGLPWEDDAETVWRSPLPQEINLEAANSGHAKVGSLPKDRSHRFYVARYHDTQGRDVIAVLHKRRLFRKPQVTNRPFLATCYRLTYPLLDGFHPSSQPYRPSWLIAGSMDARTSRPSES